MAIGVDAQTGEVIHIPDNPLEAGIRGAIQGAGQSAPVRGIASVLGGLGHVLGAPARAVAAVGQNLAGTGQRISPLDAAVYGRDMNTGQVPAQYGTLLSKVAFGEDATGLAPRITEDVGNIAGDPLVALGVGKLAGTAVAGDVGVKAQERALANLGAARITPKQPAVTQTPPGPPPSALLDWDLTTGQHAGRHIGVRDFNRQTGQWARKAPQPVTSSEIAESLAALDAAGPPVRRVPPGSARGDIGYGSYDAAVADLPPDIVGGVAGGQPFRTPRPRGGGNVERYSDVVAAEGRGPKPPYFPVSEPVEARTMTAEGAKRAREVLNRSDKTRKETAQEGGPTRAENAEKKRRNFRMAAEVMKKKSPSRRTSSPEE